MEHYENFYQKQFNIIIDLINDDLNTNISYIVSLIKKYFTINNFLIKIKKDEKMLQKFIIKCDIEYELFKIIKNNIIKKCVDKYKLNIVSNIN